MKFYLAIVGLVAGLALANGAVSGGSCSVEKGTCTSLFSGFSHVQSDLSKYTKQMLDKSFHFLLLSKVFDVHDMDRPGFEKLFRKTSDKAWDDTIELIKYQAQRGASESRGWEINGVIVHTAPALMQHNETSALKMALDYEKLMATEAHHMHKKISHAENNKQHYDPDVAHFLDEKLIEYQSQTIRKLAGYITNLDNIVNEANTKELGVKLFDDYLDKAE
uniref:Ferritin n=1 Tax=Psorophora albipes TaxID=869069 RepID=T1E2Y5_9DIPT